MWLASDKGRAGSEEAKFLLAALRMKNRPTVLNYEESLLKNTNYI
jgi:hypothetical protein